MKLTYERLWFGIQIKACGKGYVGSNVIIWVPFEEILVLEWYYGDSDITLVGLLGIGTYCVKERLVL